MKFRASFVLGVEKINKGKRPRTPMRWVDLFGVRAPADRTLVPSDKPVFLSSFHAHARRLKLVENEPSPSIVFLLLLLLSSSSSSFFILLPPLLLLFSSTRVEMRQKGRACETRGHDGKTCDMCSFTHLGKTNTLLSGVLQPPNPHANTRTRLSLSPFYPSILNFFPFFHFFFFWF